MSHLPAADRRIADSPPHRVEDEQGADAFELIGQVPEAEDGQMTFGVRGGRPVEERRERPFDEGVRPRGELGGGPVPAWPLVMSW